MKHFYSQFPSPLGELYIISDDHHLKLIVFAKSWTSYKQSCTTPPIRKETPVIKKTIQQLEQYFAGQRKEFSLSLDPEGTLFQKKAWKVLQTIPYGKTLSYSEQAQKIGNKKAVRAIGGANGKNPIPIIIPCHRVIGANGKLVGYAGGLSIKEKLLNIERS